jgi:hypothetical protein
MIAATPDGNRAVMSIGPDKEHARNDDVHPDAWHHSPTGERVPTISYAEKRLLGRRVAENGYYTDGCDLYEIADIGKSTGCVTVRDCSSEEQRCLAILDFRRTVWRVR